ncbi:hypothetical protein [Clostridium sardiniense]|uniref:hypothetical protein n=1 Tax=Clostridium sardiniense TaxID=29369 RepID=UPI00195676CA|nr:hypothetical protein [Clostridium sardiniense]MBM7835563.1 hypothetical protein [Clostridium sardiniense]
MKKKLLRLSIIIVTIIVYFCGKYHFNMIDMEKKIDKFITEKAGIPSSEILVIGQIEAFGMIGESDSNKNYVKTFTTKKDFEKWKENLKKEGKNYKDVKVKDCEIKYYCTYTPKVPKYNQTNVYDFQYSLYGGSVFSFKKIENNFAYPPNEFIKKILEKMHPPEYK